MIDFEDIDDDFDGAIEIVRKGGFNVTQDEQLKFYAYYKQVMEGPCKTSAPSFWDFTAKAKWNAWNSLGDMSPQDAKRNYVQLLTKLVPNWNQQDYVPQKAQKWVVVSQMERREDDIKDEDKTICDWIQDEKHDKVKIMIQKDPSLLSWKDEEDRTPLHFAVDGEHTDLVLFLLSQKSDINAKDNEGQTPLHYACVCEHEPLIELLLKHGADPSLKNNDQATPLDICSDTLATKMKHIL
eukprot:TRINITY_DN9182_c0_g1_i1.p2 TRINITY_DN9182_c0_g1~~TRINITY_DN9182_c0_g1_i1.p2  ORF type:complete len:239 (-),score=65.80 TRINITY_DN9182_c0_g1_i1:1336-2052(-)